MSDQNGQDYKRVLVNISSQSIIKLLVFTALALLLYLIREVIILVLAALVLSMALESWVSWLQSYRVPRTMSVIITIVLVVLLFAVVLILLIPPVVQQISDLVANFPQYYDAVTKALENLHVPGNFNLEDQISAWLNKLSGYVGGAAAGALNLVLKVFGGLISLVAFVVMTIYLVASAHETRAFFTKISPAPYRAYVSDLIPRVETKLGYWLRGQLILSFFIFVLDFAGLSIIGVHYAFLLALLAGIFEIVPFVGPIISAVPGIFFALAQSPGKALLALIVYVVVQQLEGHILAPKVMGKQVDINPVLVIIFLLAGAKLEGILGALLAVPVAAALSIIFTDVLDHKIKGELPDPPTSK